MASSMPASTANWHWKNKNVGAWAKTWFQRELTTISIKGEGEETVVVSQVVNVDGDAELGQRKSKLITIYDVKIELKWKGTAPDGTEVLGALTVPEVSHEITLDGLSEYVYNWSLATDSSDAVNALFKMVRDRLPPALESKFSEFPLAIIETHGKDLTVSAEPSRTGTPVQATAGNSAALLNKSTAPVSSVKINEPVSVNTTTITVEATFMASADDLFSILTDESRIPMWSRAPAKSTAKPGSEYSLFGGGVRGKYISVDPPKEFVQSWSLQSPNWPSGHEAILTTALKQSSDSTNVTFTLRKVPLGNEDEIKRNIEGYYVHGLKSIGLGTVL